MNLNNETEKLIIKALKSGASIRRISKETLVPERTLWAWIKQKEKYNKAYAQYIAFIDNVFTT